MIGLDTNVLLRVFVVDTAGHSAAARNLLHGLPRNGARVCLIVLVETIWAMRRNFGFGRTAIAEFVTELLDRPEFDIEERDLVEEALAVFLDVRRIDFADCLIAVSNEKAGCETSYTFDRYASALDHFTWLATTP